MQAFFSYKNDSAWVGYEPPIFLSSKLSNSRLLNNNEMFLIELITLPYKYELSVRIEGILYEAILHRSSS